MRNTLKTAGLAAGILVLGLGGCEINDATCNAECVQDNWMDSGLVPDHCGDAADSTCLVSRRFPFPSDSDMAGKHVIIAVHGFTASTYEWREFKNFAEGDTAQGIAGHGRDSILVSLVLLGGHGVSLDAFQASTWRDWGKPILDEYDSLKSKGYKNISFACASTGCALLMQFIADGQFQTAPGPKSVFMIDPIVTPAAKLLSLVDLAGPILGNSPNPGSPSEDSNWYVNRPQEDLKQLYGLINRVKNDLEDGFKLPKGTNCKVYKSEKDGSADPISALLIYKGMRKWDGSHIEAQLFDSHLHVMTRLMGREPAPTAADSALQKSIFMEMIAKELNPKP